MENTRSGLRLLKKGRRGILRAVFSRMGLILLLLLLNFALLFSFFIWFEELLPHIYGGSVFLTVCMVLYMINSKMDASAKITWLILIMIAPIFGSLLYWFTQRNWGHRAMRHRIQTILAQTSSFIPSDPEAQYGLAEESKGAASMTAYVRRYAGSPVFRNTQVRYFPSGEEKYQRLLTELEKAEKFIFLEYFIVEEGVMWGNILQILAQKAAQGVDVRLMYDGTCEFLLLPKNYPQKLRELGIQCKVFSPATPFVSTHYNYRDHRKILVIDGHTAFNGGINLADEYINQKERFGYWKDTAVMLKGEAVKSFTLMFLQMWNVEEKATEYQSYLSVPTISTTHTKGYVMPYGDSPLDSERVGQRVYLDILSRASRYVHIMTPYLILDAETENALCYTAKRGVDVKIMLPGIPDKKIPYAMAKTHYKTLLDAGVEIYEYAPGFLHAKSFVCDDAEAVVGTINLDYRSLYHHFECATYLYGSDCIADIEEDFQSSLKKCRKASFMTIKREKWYMRLLGYVMKTVAPLM